MITADVRLFHERFGVPVGTRPQLLSATDFTYRLAFLREELTELEAAHAAGDLAEVADALVDLVYVAVGTALWAGLDFDAHWREVQRANLAKVRTPAPGASRRGHGHDVVKPLGWRPPCHEPILLATRNAHAEVDQ